MFGRLKYRQQNHYCLRPVFLRIRWLLKKFKNKSPGTDQISGELIKAGGSKICCEIPKHIHSIWNKEDLPEQWQEAIIVPVYKKGDKTD